MKQDSMKMANIKQNRFLSIAKLKSDIFRIGDLARIWNISDRNTLSTTLKRYVQDGLIYRLQRGLYSIKPVGDLDPLILGSKAMGTYCYLSGETVLARHGVIFQEIAYYTFMGERGKRFKIGEYRYYCRQLKDSFLYNDFGIERSEGLKQATLERAVADILYFNPKYYFDNPKAIDQKKLKEIQRLVYNK